MIAVGIAPGNRQRRAQDADSHEQDRSDLINAHHAEPNLIHPFRFSGRRACHSSNSNFATVKAELPTKSASVINANVI
jgi:hypothetical protein